MMNQSRVRCVKQNMGHEKGFTLLEALIAFVVLAGGLLAAYRFHSTTLGVTAESKVRAQATALAEQKVEDLRNFQTLQRDAAYASCADEEADDTLSFECVVDGSGLGDLAGADYAAAFTLVWDRDEGYGDNPRKVDVTVSWKDREDIDETVTLSSIIWGNNPQDDAAGIALSLNHAGEEAIDYYADGNGNPITPGGGGGGEVAVTPVTLHDYTEPDENDPEGTAYFYDISFVGDIIFTDEGLASVGISGGPDDSATCALIEPLPAFQYSCTILRVPNGDTWTGTLTYNPAGNDAVCTPGTTLGISIDQLTTFLELEVVVMTNNGACNQL
ncbi:MAG: prepilin-type N-terminal cleavage/methylation domain-containing protein [Gammaproteobacteria bacterium]|nr:prepilin-type N-terminal cleavage/methylation domain-containing protein [Gammaproteobacteria bacterium]MBQ0840933.1 prepilin-type N-terminal cleavage/methylation domain-containing protein [Gammaproteobacteria bacterium]